MLESEAASHGIKTLLLTQSIDVIGQLSCNVNWRIGNTYGEITFWWGHGVAADQSGIHLKL